MAIKNDSLGDRMKRYEAVPKVYLTRRVPAIIRVDGKAFHTITRGMVKPFDAVLMAAMQDTMEYLCENIQGCVLGYTQSDEITLVLTDYATVKTDAWFGYNVEKMTSIAASMATLAFNRALVSHFGKFFNKGIENHSLDIAVDTAYRRAIARGALFDARTFNVPKDEVANCLIWRQQDATRNSIEAVGQANFSQKQLHGKNCNEIQDMLFKEKGINWNDFPPDCKRGAACRKLPVTSEIDDPKNPGNKIMVERRKWMIDHETPIFQQDRDYIERLI